MVKIYGFSGCPYCKELKELLTKDGIQFIDVDIDLPENQEEFNKIMEVSVKSIQEAFELTKKFLV